MSVGFGFAPSAVADQHMLKSTFQPAALGHWQKKARRGSLRALGHPSLTLLKEGGEARLSDGTDVSRHAITILFSILIKCNLVGP